LAASHPSLRELSRSKLHRILTQGEVRPHKIRYYVNAGIRSLKRKMIEVLSNDVIVSRLDTPRQIVSKWRWRFSLARIPGLEAQPRGGRKARFSPSLVAQVKALACNSRIASDFLCPAFPLRRSGNT
jgi:hypothetical protein